MRQGIFQSICLILGLLVISALPVAAQEGNVEKGKRIAEQHCSRCHVVGDFNPSGGIASTPSFRLLVRRRPDYKDRFRTFYTRRPHPAFLTIKGLGRLMEHLPANAAPVELTLEDVKDMVAFAVKLKKNAGTPQKPFVLRPRPKPRMR